MTTGPPTPPTPSNGLITRLLPQSSMFPRVLNNLGKFFRALDEELDELIDAANNVYLDMIPSETENLEAWADQFSLPTATVEALEAVWKEHRDMSPQHIEDRLTEAGYTVEVFDWWVPGSEPKVPRDPEEAEYFLVDGKLVPDVFHQMRIGDSIARCGDSRARVGYQVWGDPKRVVYDAPTNKQGIIYIRYTDTGDRLGFERLALKIVPNHLWIGVLPPIGGPE